MLVACGTRKKTRATHLSVALLQWAGLWNQ